MKSVYHIANCIIAVLFVLVFSLEEAMSQQAKDPGAWTVDDVLKQEHTGRFAISHDGKWVVWEKRRPDQEENRQVVDLYLSSMTDSTTVQLTRGKYSDHSPAWSPDNKTIAFLSAREKEKGSQIWIMHAFGGEPEQITHLEKGVQQFKWLDKDHILFTAREDEYLREKELKEKKDDTIIVGDQEHYYPVRLFKLSVKDKKIERISTNSGRIVEFAISPDGQWVVTNENQSVHYQYDFKIPPKQFLYNLKTGERKEIFTDPHVNPYRYVWDLDGKGFYCARDWASDTTNTYVGVPLLYYFDLATETLHKVPLDWERAIGGPFFATRSGVLVTLADGVWNRLAFYQKEGRSWSRRWLDHETMRNLSIQTVGPDGTSLVYIYSTASTPPKIFRGRIEETRIADAHEFIKLNTWMEKKNIAKTEVIRWKGALGDEVEGLLYFPHNYKPGKKYPLVTMIHGGPTGVDRDSFFESWSRYPNIMASRGAFVLRVNYHGSGNYGLEWMESIKGHYYEYEVPDILSGIDYVIEQGYADPDRLGIMGWSNGSILAIQACIESDRFKVLGAGAGDVNWFSDYGNCAFGAAFDNNYFGGPPWEIPNVYLEKSPLFKMPRVTTPTIIFFGTEDVNVPTEQGWQHYRALQQIGKAPVRFLLFPGEPHGLRKFSHQRRKMEEELAWFDKYLFKTFEKPNEAFKKSSPLAYRLERMKAAQQKGVFGKKIKGVLTPETVKHENIEVGRFEVTRAQYREFQKSYRVQPGEENWPANNISFKQAKAYCEWLSKKTGRKYRLPTEDEMNSLLKLANGHLKQENNLDYWVGYSPNPDEVAALQSKIAEAEKGGLLLKEVGSFPPAGDSGIYDLGGNVAEWCTTKNGKGKVMGLSAISPADQRYPYKPPRRVYVGFRVVREK